MDYTQKSTKSTLALKLSVSATITPGGLPQQKIEVTGMCIIRLSKYSVRSHTLEVMHFKYRYHRLDPYLHSKTRPVISHIHWYGDRQRRVIRQLRGDFGNIYGPLLKICGPLL